MHATPECSWRLRHVALTQISWLPAGRRAAARMPCMHTSTAAPACWMQSAPPVTRPPAAAAHACMRVLALHACATRAARSRMQGRVHSLERLHMPASVAHSTAPSQTMDSKAKRGTEYSALVGTRDCEERDGQEMSLAPVSKAPCFTFPTAEPTCMGTLAPPVAPSTVQVAVAVRNCPLHAC